jgi:hypothetical protein
MCFSTCTFALNPPDLAVAPTERRKAFRERGGFLPCATTRGQLCVRIRSMKLLRRHLSKETADAAAAGEARAATNESARCIAIASRHLSLSTNGSPTKTAAGFKNFIVHRRLATIDAR